MDFYSSERKQSCLLIFRTAGLNQKCCCFQNREKDACWSGRVKGGSCPCPDCCNCLRLGSVCRCGSLALVCICCQGGRFRLSMVFLDVAHTLGGNCRSVFPDDGQGLASLAQDDEWDALLECCLSCRVLDENCICGKG